MQKIILQWVESELGLYDATIRKDGNISILPTKKAGHYFNDRAFSFLATFVQANNLKWVCTIGQTNEGIFVPQVIVIFKGDIS